MGYSEPLASHVFVTFSAAVGAGTPIISSAVSSLSPLPEERGTAIGADGVASELCPPKWLNPSDAVSASTGEPATGMRFPLTRRDHAKSASSC